MTDRLARFCGTSLAALGLLLGALGCGQERHTADAPPVSTPLAAPAEPPRLLREMTADQPMDSPLVLSGASERAAMPYPRGGLSTPPADRGANGDEISNSDATGSPLAVSEPSGENLLQPPADRKSGFVGDDEAPLPELVPFDTPDALAAHASSAARGESDNLATDVVSVPEASNAADVASYPAAEQQDSVDSTTETAEPVAASDTPAVVAATEEPQQTPVDKGPLPSTGALAISKVESVGPTDRNVARFSMPSGGAPESSAESPASSAVASQESTRQSPVPSKLADETESKVEPESLAVSPPPAKRELPAIAPGVVPLKPQAAPGELAREQNSERTPDAMMTGVRPTVPSVAATPSTAAAPPSSVAHQPATTATGRGPLPATELPRQAPVVANSLPAEPARSSVVAKRVTTPPPSAIVDLEQRSAAGGTAVGPRPLAVTKQPMAHRPLGQPLSEQTVNRPPVERRSPATAALPSGQALVPAPSSVVNKSPQVKPVPETAGRQPVQSSSLAGKNAAGQPAAARPAQQPARVAAAKPSQPATRELAVRDRALPAAPRTAAPMRSNELMAVSRMADEHTRQAFNLANRGALYSARDEFIEALQMVAHAIDAEQRTYEHSQALSDGLTAIRESDDFTSRGGRSQDNIDVVTIAKSHSTPVLKGLEPKSVSRMAAMQQYYTYGQRRLALAVSAEPSGSVALYGLGKLYTVLAQMPPQGIVAPEPKAIVFHQAALLVDGRNYMAANDLGVLLARYGKYQQAKSALLHSLSIAPQPAGWHNLTVVHQHLGEAKLAQLAQVESQAAKARAKQIARASGQSKTDTTTVVWLDPVTFSRSSEMWSDPVKPKSPENAAQSTASKPPVAPPADSPKKSWFRK